MFSAKFARKSTHKFCEDRFLAYYQKENLMDYPECLSKLKILLSKDFNCTPEDFDREENILTVSALIEGRRKYSAEKYFFNMATLGKNAVITADERLFPFLREYIKDKNGFWLFEQPHITVMEKEMNKYGYTFEHSHHLYLPAKKIEPMKSFPVKWFYGYEEIKGFYGDKRFPNALCEEYAPDRPDTMAVCAYDEEGEIMGMAGCSEDAAGWQQIGIDVIPEYRSRGIGAYLVKLLKNKIEEKGDIPFYGTGIVNFRSMRIALSSGFKPTWAEIHVRKITDR